MPGEPLRIARTVDDRLLLGDDEGFAQMPPREYISQHGPQGVLTAAATGTLPGLDELASSKVPEDHQHFDVPFHPGKLWGIGLNYADHASDLDESRPTEPASFMKPRSTLVGPGGPIRLPSPEISDRVTAEAELGVVIGRTCKDIDEETFEDIVAGFVPVIDVTAEDILQRNPRFLTRAKSFDSFLVVGPWLSVPATVNQLRDTTVRTIKNGDVIAENTLDRMLFSPPELVSFHSKVMTLEPGDLISTGTPGAVTIKEGDTVTAEVTGVGSLSADVVRNSSKSSQ